MRKIEHKNGTMTVTTANRNTAARKTDNLYKSAIVGKNAAGKWVVVFAGITETAARDALAKFNAGGFVNHKFRGVEALEVVSATADDLDAIAAITAERLAAWESSREQAAINANAAQWVPEDDPDAWKARDAATIAAHRARAA